MGETLSASDLSDFNVGAWATGDYVADYSTRTVSPAETVLLASYRGSLNGPVLEIGPGAGRLTRILVSLFADVTAVDVSPRMVEACRRNVPEARVMVGDLRDLSRFDDGSFRSIVASDNVIDVLDPAGRERALAGLARLLRGDGMLLFSSHNRANLPYLDTRLGSFANGALRSPRAMARTLYHAPRILRRARNRHRARAFEQVGDGWAIVNDPVHEHRLAHYYVTRAEQERQLAAAGLTLLGCFDTDGAAVPSGEDAEHSTELHYAAQRRTSAAN
ncbi:MAG: hypothetical protein QOG77_2156 [Solirubrobacteraceae bacterium]|nr:hypothetical protein [Solirubrobacteraceae bacterium]